MSVKIGSETIRGYGGQQTDPYGLPVQDSAPRTAESKPNSPRKSYGVRVPILRDLDGKFIGRPKPTSCRFDIVEKVTTVIKPGTYGPSLSDPGSEQTPKHDGDHNIKRMSRQPTFHSTLSNSTHQGDQKDASVVEKIGPYHWNMYVKYSKEGDARDVLYRNTYCQVPDHIRYRTLTLPRISTAATKDRPWTVAGDEKPIVTSSDHGEYSKVITIIPQRPRGTVVRFREYMKPFTRESDGRPMEVKRYTTKTNQNTHFTTVKSGFPLIKHDFRRSLNKTERPLKFENTRYTKKHRETLYNKHILPAYKNAFDRDYSSADTFKEYLENLQHTAKANTPGMHTREWTTYHEDQRQSIDYHNRVLKSVSDVNQPENESKPDNHEISVEIKQFKQIKSSQDIVSNDATGIQKPVAIDNLSSVHGSVVRAHSDTHSVTVPRSSSVVDAKSVVKIPTLLTESLSGRNGEAEDDQEEAHDEVDDVVQASSLPNTATDPVTKLQTVIGETKCPANSPDPDIDDI